jgi:hypothetical protein
LRPKTCQALFEIFLQGRAVTFFFDLVETGESVRILRNGKPIADIVPIAADMPSWKQRKAQPLVLDGVAISQLILNEREA